LLAACLALACWALAAPAAAGAETITVDSTADEADALLGNELCATAASKCTLRAAIEESNFSSGEPDQIEFDENVFDGGASSTITLSSALPPLTDRGLIHGRVCQTAAGVAGPCVEIAANGAATGLTIAAEEVEIEGVAVTGADVGIEIEAFGFFHITGSWFGIHLDGSPGGNGVGVLADPGSTRGRIGGEGPEAGNLFANESEYGVRLFGARHVAVLGNRFGVGADGTTTAANGTDIAVASAPVAGFEAIEDTIGTRVSVVASATPACDGGCNLIANADVGIDLSGVGPEEGPAVAATVRGNQIGLDASGAEAAEEQGIAVGAAPQAVVGGPRPEDANRINGGDVAIAAGPEAPDLVVRSNLIGLDAAGQAVQAAPASGIEVDSGELTNPALEAILADNRVGMEGGTGIAQHGSGATIAGNFVVGASTGILAVGANEEHGSRIERNMVEGAGENGIRVENGFNEIFGNEVLGSGAAGIAIKGGPPSGVTENLVGGDSAASENVVSLSLGPAIEILDLKNSINTVARNRGFGNLGAFIDLVAAEAGPNPVGPNNGIQPPAVASATQAGASGSAEPGARVRVFRKQSSSAGEIESFLGEAVAGEDGNWQVSYASAIPAGSFVAATQTGESGTSELSIAATAGATGGGSGPAPQPDLTAPKTRLRGGPPRRSSHRTARFTFSADEAGSTFQCRLDRARFRPCRSPLTYRHLKPGSYRFEVRAVDAAGNVDTTPAKESFTVLRPRR